MNLTKELLKEYQQCENEIIRLENRIEHYANLVIPSEHGVVRGSMREYPYAEKSFILSGSNIKSDKERNDKLNQLLFTLEERKKYFIDLDIQVGLAIESIENAEMRVIFVDKFINHLTDAEIADKFGYERSCISKKITKFLKDSQNSQS